MDRRDFIKRSALSAAAGALGCATDTGAAARRGGGEIWAALLHMGTNMWSDQPVSS